MRASSNCWLVSCTCLDPCKSSSTCAKLQKLPEDDDLSRMHGVDGLQHYWMEVSWAAIARAWSKMTSTEGRLPYNMMVYHLTEVCGAGESHSRAAWAHQTAFISDISAALLQVPAVTMQPLQAPLAEPEKCLLCSNQRSDSETNTRHKTHVLLHDRHHSHQLTRTIHESNLHLLNT